MKALKPSPIAERLLPAYAPADRLKSTDGITALIRTATEAGRNSGQRPRRSPTERWGGNQRLFSDGFLSVPTKFLRHYASLLPPLSSGEALFVLQIMTFKWESAAPFPAYKRIAKAMGVTDKMARRYARQHRAPNRFDLTGLFEALAKLP